MSKLQSNTNYITVENSPDIFQVWKSTGNNSGQNSRIKNKQRAITPKAWSFELWFLCTFLNAIYLPMKFHVDALYSFQVMLRTKFKYKNQQGATTKSMMHRVMFLCNALSLNEIYLSMKFQASSLITFSVIIRTKFKNENKQRAITPKVWSFKLWFLCTALLLNEINLPKKFHVDALHSSNVMLRTKMGNGNM